MKDSKELVKYMYDYHVTCSCDELLRFRKSAATAAIKNREHAGVLIGQSGLVQVVADNVDIEISSPKWKAISTFPRNAAYTTR